MATLTPAEITERFRSEPDSFIDVGDGDGEVAYRRFGEGPDVLFVHGWPVSGATFRKVIPHLAEHITCHVVDLLSSGSSRFSATTPMSIEQHILSVQRVVDHLGTSSLAVVGHDSGGMIARHALVGDSRLRAMGLINTEQSRGLSWRFKMFLGGRNLPGFERGLGWVAGQPKLRRNRYVLGDAFADASLLEGEFDEFFLRPLHNNRDRLHATIKILRTFDERYVRELAAIHRRIDVPVQLVWGDRDPFFPLAWAEEMVPTFPNAKLAVIKGAGLFSHEERAQEVATALLPTLTGCR